jgi:2-(1,2-epoxy-1,2-dihydrophenyl)acetyl-CoA isomerase
MTMDDASVLVERLGAIALVTLNRPARRNGVTTEMCERLYQVLHALSSEDARVLILRGEGDDFSVGADLGAVRETAARETTAPETASPETASPETTAFPSFAQISHVYHAATLLHTMPQVTIAAIDGGCAGASMGWAAACDFRFASDRARFSTAFLNVGVSGDMGLAWCLPRLLGAARARELLLFPEKITAAQALQFGFVTRLFGAQALHGAVLSLAEQLAARNPIALRMMKANLLSAEQLGLREYIEIESARHLHGMASSFFGDEQPGG